jgi:ribosomal protein L37E
VGREPLVQGRHLYNKEGASNAACGYGQRAAAGVRIAEEWKVIAETLLAGKG